MRARKAGATTMNYFRRACRVVRGLVAAAAVIGVAGAAAAQQAPTATPRVPSYFDANVRMEKPNVSTIRVNAFSGQRSA